MEVVVMMMTNVFVRLYCLLAGLSEAFVICPYCDPNHMHIPNLEESCRGYDVPMGNPNPPRGNSDPGIRNQIFSPMFRNDDGYYQLDRSFVTANTMIKCDATWSSSVYDNLKTYVDGKAQAMSTGFGIETGVEMEGYIYLGNTNQPSKVTIPPLFTRSWMQNKDRERVKDFYTKEGGSIVVTEAICLTHKVDISDISRKIFVEPFIDAILMLAKAQPDKREFEFKRFINEFGTHYHSTSEMGTKLTIERRYTSKERSLAGDNELKECNTKAGLRIFGLQAEIDKVDCDRAELLDDVLNSTTVERTVISTYGSFIANSLADWSRQVVDLVQGGSFNPRVIKRELRSILHLFQDKNLNGTLAQNVNVTQLLDWMTPMMNNYCGVFGLNCHEVGCGIDDACKPGKKCIDGKMPEANQTYICVEESGHKKIKNSSSSHVGEIDGKMRKKMEFLDGEGFEYSSRGTLKYSGNFKNGERHGNGTLYYPNGNKAYVGNFSRGQITGHGTFLHKKTRKELFRGTIGNNSELQKGILYDEDGTSMGWFNNSRFETSSKPF